MSSQDKCFCGGEIQHPDITWARAVVKLAKGDRVTDEDLETMRWDDLMGCYFMFWAGMLLGIETDGHMHS
jgi:hypothetical protein